jgi:SAM-dependent methyltransferase
MTSVGLTSPTAEPPAREAASVSDQGLNLFITGFLVLFLELSCIRWFAANVVFLQFFTNVVLLACFLGMSCGCLAARQRRNWLNAFPVQALAAVLGAGAMLAAYYLWNGLTIDVGHQTSPQEVFFGTEYRSPDISKFTVPIDLIVAVFFVAIAFLFVGLGQVLGRAFDAYPDRVMGYTLNIGGSLAGTAGFSLLSLVQAPPAVWFAICAVGVAFLLWRSGGLNWPRATALLALPFAVSAPAIQWAHSHHQTFWSPYYSVEYSPKNLGISVNNIGHQEMAPFASGGSSYSLIHLLERDLGGPPFKDVLIIGAGSGNDVDHALRYGVSHVDAVEIDPVIQGLGVARNPDHPYDDPRVARHIDDGRHFLRTTDRQYDLVVYALVDSLILHSGYANIRLESYLFTRQALVDIKSRLKPGGVFVTYNYFRQGWVVQRVAAMAQGVFGCKPIVISLPYRDTLPASSPAGFTMIIAGCNPRISAAFAQDKTFWLNRLPALNRDINGFAVRPETLPTADRTDWQRIAPTRIIDTAGAPRFATDDWPFLYLHGAMIPDLSIRSMIVLGVLGLGMVYLFLPKTKGRIGRFDGRMFFLGAAFMLLETKAVVQLALLFGSTWVVNSAVFFTALTLVLLANLYVLRAPPRRLLWHYVGLLGLMGAAIAIPVEVFLGGGVLWRYAVPSVLALGPMFFAGVIFAKAFKDSPDPDMAFGANIAGSVVGGLAESFSMLLGFRYLLLLAVALYLLSAWFAPGRGRAATAD